MVIAPITQLLIDRLGREWALRWTAVITALGVGFASLPLRKKFNHHVEVRSHR